MDIVGICVPYIYSVQYDGEEENEFDRLFSLWNDVGFVTQFIENNKEYLKADVWNHIPEVEDAARQVLDEAVSLECLFDEINRNTTNGGKSDFDSQFHYLDGKYKYELDWPPMKSYGTGRPSLLRLYAVKMDTNTYVITGGGIKLSKTIQDSPDLKDHVLQNIERVRDYLIENGIVDGGDL